MCDSGEAKLSNVAIYFEILKTNYLRRVSHARIIKYDTNLRLVSSDKNVNVPISGFDVVSALFSG